MKLASVREFRSGISGYTQKGEKGIQEKEILDDFREFKKSRRR